jgi:hypothetical protein
MSHEPWALSSGSYCMLRFFDSRFDYALIFLKQLLRRRIETHH